MGTLQSALDCHDCTNTPIYCIGFPEDIHFSADDEPTNQKLLKLKSADRSKMFKYRIKDKSVLKYFHQHAAFMITVQPLRSGVGFGIIGLVDRKSIKVHSVASILKKQLKMEQTEGLHIYRNGTMMQDYQRIQYRKQDAALTIVKLQYSKLEVLG